MNIIEETNRALEKIAAGHDGVRRLLESNMTERYILSNNPSVVFGDYIAEADKILLQLRRRYYEGTRDRNEIVKDVVELINSLIEVSQEALVKVRMSGPEDVNENEDKGFFPLTTKDYVQVAQEKHTFTSADRIKKTGNLVHLYTKKIIPKDDTPVMFWIDNIVYKLDQPSDGYLILKPYDRQSSATSIIFDLAKTDRYDSAVSRFKRLS